MYRRNYCIVTRRTGATAYDLPATMAFINHGRYCGVLRADAVALCLESLARIQEGRGAMDVELFECAFNDAPLSDPIIPTRMNNAGWWHHFGVETEMELFDRETWDIEAARNLFDLAHAHLMENLEYSESDIDVLLDEEIGDWIIDSSDEEDLI